MLNDITFGQYVNVNSFVHRLDPRVKILLIIVFVVLIFVAGNFAGLILTAAITLFVIVLTKVPFKMYLKNLKAVLPVIIFTALINMLYAGGGAPVLDWWIFHITTGGIARAVFMASRVMLLILSSATLTYTTTPNDLTDAIERLLSPLKYIGLQSAVHMLAMMMTIALRFIPTLVEETGKIMNAQKARGASFDEGKLIERIKALIPILIPLLVSAIRRAYELAEAMECRCYNGGKGKQRMKQLHIGLKDFFACAFITVYLAGVILLNIFF